MAETGNKSNMSKMAIVLEVQMSARQDGLMAKLLDGFMAMAMWLDGNSPSIHLTIDEMAT